MPPIRQAQHADLNRFAPYGDNCSIKTCWTESFQQAKSQLVPAPQREKIQPPPTAIFGSVSRRGSMEAAQNARGSFDFFRLIPQHPAANTNSAHMVPPPRSSSLPPHTAPRSTAMARSRSDQPASGQSR